MKLKLYFQQHSITILSFIVALLLFLIIDLFINDLPPYSIKLGRVKSIIYFQNPLEVYSTLYYEREFLFNTPLKGRGIELFFPIEKNSIEKIIDLRFGGFEYINFDNNMNLKGFISYKDFNPEKSIYLKLKLKNDNEYIHSFDLPYSWSSDAQVEHDIFVRKNSSLVIINILPLNVEESGDYYIIKIKNINRERVKIFVRR